MYIKFVDFVYRHNRKGPFCKSDKGAPQGYPRERSRRGRLYGRVVHWTLTSYVSSQSLLWSGCRRVSGKGLFGPEHEGSPPFPLLTEEGGVGISDRKGSGKGDTPLKHWSIGIPRLSVTCARFVHLRTPLSLPTPNTV